MTDKVPLPLCYRKRNGFFGYGIQEPEFRVCWGYFGVDNPISGPRFSWVTDGMNCWFMMQG